MGCLTTMPVDDIFFQVYSGNDMINKIPKALFYGQAESVFGECCIAFDESKLYAVLFSDNKHSVLTDLQHRFPETHFRQNDEEAFRLGERIFSAKGVELELAPVGTVFQQSVWDALRQIPFGTTCSYSDIARRIGKPNAVRAVGSAIGANPIAWLIPCHRVLRSDGSLGGYRWGLERKQKMLEWECEKKKIPLLR